VQNGFFKVAGYSAIALPCATVVMCVDQFVLPRILKVTRPVEPIPEWRSTALGNWPAIVAVLVSVLFGAWGQVLLPGQTSAPTLGIVPVEAWIMAGVLYVALAALAASEEADDRCGDDDACDDEGDACCTKRLAPPAVTFPEETYDFGVREAVSAIAGSAAKP
jgi:cytosine/uracil/thiamine/allantoin permease